MIELRCLAREGEAKIPRWAVSLGAERLATTQLPAGFTSGFQLEVPLMDTTLYLDYVAARFRKARGGMRTGVRFDALEDVERNHPIIVNCAGIGAQTLVPDPELEPHRGQVVIVPGTPQTYAVVCNDAPLMYAIPRAGDCVFGGRNDVSADRNPEPATSAQIVAECSRALHIEPPRIIGERVGLRPYRRAGVCLRADRLSDGLRVIHNCGHGGSGFTLSWGCAREVLAFARETH
ncbi:MAG: FAD-dependent oxidoreductase [Chthoniobacterales bacterium]